MTICCVTLFGVSGCSKRKVELSSEQVTERVILAEKLEQNKDYRRAAAIWQQLAELHPENGYYLYHLGWNYSRLQDDAKAEAYLVHSLKIDPTNGDAMVTLGYLYLRTNRLEKAKALFEQTLEKFPHNDDAKLGLEEVEARQRMAALEQERSDQKQQLLELKERALNEMKEGDYDAALRDWQEVLKANRNNTTALFYIGEAYRFKQENRQAEIYLKESLAVDPKNTDAIYGLGLLYHQMGEEEQAEKTFNKLKEMAPDYPGIDEALENLKRERVKTALVLQERGETDQALKIWLTLLDQDPQLEVALYQVGLIYLRQQELANAELFFNRAYQVNPKNVDALLFLGQIYFRTDRFELAAQAFEEVLKQVPDYTDAKVGLEQIAVAEKKNERAS